MKSSCVYFLLLIIGASTIISCQKEVDENVTGGSGGPGVKQKPRVGTTWYYRFYTRTLSGALLSGESLTFRAKSEETIGGEKWLKIVDVAQDTVVWLLNEKAGGLYQYTNSNSNLLCKFPAALNDTYTTFNEGASEVFTVRGVNDTMPIGVFGGIPVNYYEGVKNAYIIDVLWYNEYGWIVQKRQYRVYYFSPQVGSVHYKYSDLFLDDIVY